MTTRDQGGPKPSDLLAHQRAQIDALDDRIVDLLVERFGIVAQVACIKRAHGIAPVLPDRIDAVRARVAARAQAAGLSGGLLEKLYTAIIAHACSLEESYINQGVADRPSAQILPQSGHEDSSQEKV